MGADDGAVADGDAVEDGRARADPDAGADANALRLPRLFVHGDRPVTEVVIAAHEVGIGRH